MDVYLLIHGVKTHEEYRQKITKSVAELADAYRSASEAAEKVAKAMEDLPKVLKNSKCGKVEK